jgi:DNA-binding MurR/RpiR family transcriptional regulator
MVAAVLAQPRQAALAAAAELARQSAVQEATASRLAHKLRFDGSPAFRASLQSEFLPTVETATLMQRAMRNAGEGGALATLAAAERAGLGVMLSNTSEAQVLQAAGWLMAADIHLWAWQCRGFVVADGKEVSALWARCKPAVGRCAPSGRRRSGHDQGRCGADPCASPTATGL